MKFFTYKVRYGSNKSTKKQKSTKKNKKYKNNRTLFRIKNKNQSASAHVGWEMAK
jgi:hypothetical protein